MGLRTWQNTAAVWARGILEDDYDLDIHSVGWWTQDEEDLPVDPGSAGFKVQRVPEGDDIDSMLVRGDLEAIIYPDLPPSYRKGDARVRRLFPDARQEEQRYYQRTGIFPIMHTVVIRDSLVQAYPWLPMNVVKAFRRSKDLGFRKMEDPRTVSLAWFRDALEEQRRILGVDPWPRSAQQPCQRGAPDPLRPQPGHDSSGRCRRGPLHPQQHRRSAVVSLVTTGVRVMHASW